MNKSLKKRSLISLKQKILFSKLKNQSNNFSSFTILKKKSNKRKVFEKLEMNQLEPIPEIPQEPVPEIPEIPQESIPEIPQESIPEIPQESIPEIPQEPKEIIPETQEQPQVIKIHAHSMQLADQPTIMEIKPIFGYVDSLEHSDSSDTSSIFSSFNKWSSLRFQQEPRNVKMTPRSWTTNEMVSVIKKINVE
jgi:outer membrane biosynthesis protein TonB